MYKVCLAKFQQHPDIQKILLETGDMKLVEHTKNDRYVLEPLVFIQGRYWADGGDGTGVNMLGQTLVKVRKTIRESTV
jgi:predicted NAD-dependent protein-ADP-ribosyltransferase YbiA (DUF1768 family)